MTPIIKKGENDYKQYKIIDLENNLKAILASDIKSCTNENDSFDIGIQKSAAALCINVGSFEDPFELQGLAHYLEHMVFMGSKKYPTENEFDVSVNQHGGSTNAWTDAERTLFYFDCHQEHFEDILDKFANFFISPLLLKSAMDREVNAVNSEFEMSYSDDSSRQLNLLQSIAKCDSPFRIMNSGNTKSLKTDPELRNIDVYKYLQEFRNMKYSAHNMTLAVQSRDTLDNIEEIVRHIFSSIPFNDVPKPNMEIYQKPFDTKEFNQFYQIVPVNDIYTLKLTWDMPPVLKYYKSQPYPIISYIMAHEGVGSLTHYLRKLNLIVELESGNGSSGYYSTSFNSLFETTVVLTELGFEKIIDVIEIIFSFINLLQDKGIPERLVYEIQQIRANKFRFLEQDEPIGVVEALAQNMQYFEPVDLISGDFLIENINMELYNHLVSLMTVDKVNIMVCSRQFESQTDRQTEWYDVKYNVRDFNEDEKQVWSNPRQIDELDLPMENKFIATNFDLISIENEVEFPVNLNQTKYNHLSIYGDMWHLLDKNFRTPKGYIYFSFEGEYLRESVENATLLDIVLYGVNQQLNTEVYDATEAGLGFKVKHFSNYINIFLNGFSDKLLNLFVFIIDQFSKFSLDEFKLDVYKETLRRGYVNKLIQPNELIREIYSKIILPNQYLVLEKLDILKDINVNQVVEFTKSIFCNTSINSYFHGNICEDISRRSFEYAVEQLKLSGNAKLSKDVIRRLPNDQTHIRVVSLNKADKNIGVWNVYQLGPATLELQAFNELLGLILGEPCFDFLRTKETLGYSVGFDESMECGILSSMIFVQSESDKFSLDHCREKMDYFFDTMGLDILENMSTEAFDEFKESLISNKIEDDISMLDIVSRNWNEIQRQDYIFDRRFQLVDIINEIEKVNLIEFFKSYLNTETRRKFTIEVDSRDKSQNLNTNEMKLEYLPICSEKQSSTIEEVISNSTTYPIVNFTTVCQDNNMSLSPASSTSSLL